MLYRKNAIKAHPDSIRPHTLLVHPSRCIYITKSEKLEGKGIPRSIELDGGASIRSTDDQDNDDNRLTAIVVAHRKLGVSFGPLRFLCRGNGESAIVIILPNCARGCHQVCPPCFA
jgi:hypothetical protein